MTVQVKYLENGVGIEIIESGTVTGEEVIEAHKEIYNEENFEKQKYKIVDRTDCAKYQVYPEDIVKIAEIDDEASRINSNLIIAVISTTALQHGMTRMWQSYMKNDAFIIKNFPDRTSADNWINSYIDTS
jgi:hypothetical protein